MLRTTLSRAHAINKAAPLLRAHCNIQPITCIQRFYSAKEPAANDLKEISTPETTLRSLHPFLRVHDSTKFSANFLTVETESGKRDFEDREKYRTSVALRRSETPREKIKDIQNRKQYVEGLDKLFGKTKPDNLVKLHQAVKTASLAELKDICNKIDSDAVLGDTYAALPNYQHVRKGAALSVVAQNIIFRYQKLTEEAGEPLDADPLFKLVGYIYARATNDVSFSAEAADALFWATCKSGTIEDITAVATMLAGMNTRPSDYTVSEVLAPALRPLTKIPDVNEKTAEVISLFALRPVFCQDIPPKMATIMFGLCSRMDEFVSAFNNVRRVESFKNRHAVFEEAAPAMIKAIVRCTKNEVTAKGPEQDDIFVRFEVTRPHHQAMANMFSLARLLRHSENSSFPQKAIETALVQCAKEGNIAGLNKVLSWTDLISKRATERVLALFPYAHGMAEEPLTPSIGISSMFQETSYVGHVKFLESLKKKTEAKELISEIDEKLESID
ncbi:hypothetical protein B0I71DRAFT_122923 [Yarrowia lipolytica]|uniref:Uncharacterized protein n=1 Tax=Yarrowia lipolytica TaxID=4952 RepID=A0A371C0U7_YARLL|nr:hypothetical protein B0I71DRAFT_122923 [Yarrowia lipolytica]